ncbi:MAG TPA: Na+/H+ antiporter NhaA, partial [Caulobacteraceae bacterium]|nr:Na+/H+ antiporter NhaA [Caulobacteraceae bacterium]
TAAGVSLTADLAAPNADRVLWGVVAGLALGKPVGIIASVWAAVGAKIAVAPADASRMAFIGAACLCGIGDPLSILMAEQAFHGQAYGAVAKLGILVGSAIAAVLGAAALSFSPRPATSIKPALAAKPVTAKV